MKLAVVKMAAGSTSVVVMMAAAWDAELRPSVASPTGAASNATSFKLDVLWKEMPVHQETSRPDDLMNAEITAATAGTKWDLLLHREQMPMNSVSSVIEVLLCFHSFPVFLVTTNELFLPMGLFIPVLKIYTLTC